MHQPTTNETPSAPPIEWYDLTFSDVTTRNQTHYTMSDLALRTNIQLPDVRAGGEAVKDRLGPAFYQWSISPQAAATVRMEYWAATDDRVLYGSFNAGHHRRADRYAFGRSYKTSRKPMEKTPYQIFTHCFSLSTTEPKAGCGYYGN